VIKTLGYILFVLCCLAWLMILVIPWLGFSKGQSAGIITGLIIFGEVTFYASILMLGKTFYNKIREKFRFRRKKDVKDDTEENRVA
jgi:ABC-type Na+ efflux pump permease subunit